jgi:HlyD family secretion protein
MERVVALLALLICGTSCRSNHVESAFAASRSAPAGVACLGRIIPGDRIIKVAAPPQAIVKELLVKRGSVVKAGQVIATLRDYDTAAAALEEAVVDLKVANSTLAQAKAGDKPAAIAAQQAAVEAQESVHRNAEKNLQRKKELSREGLLPGADLEASQLALETAQHGLTQQRELLESLQQVRVQDVELAQRRLELAGTKVDTARVALNRNRIQAPASGTVLEIHAYPGESVTGQGILDLGNLRNMYVLAEVYMSDVPRVRTGSQASITGEGFEGILSGRVDEILRVASNNDVYPTDPLAAADRRVLGVRIRLDDGARVEHLSNSQVSVRIEP